MSSGHKLLDGPGLGAASLEALLQDPDIIAKYYALSRLPVTDYEVPYTSGRSSDGTRFYVDEDVPELADVDSLGGKSQQVDLRQFMWHHEALEHALMSVRGWNYRAAHSVATALERRQVLAAGLSWRSYCAARDACAKTKTVARPPADLDLSALDPRDRVQTAKRQRQMAGGKVAKETVHYASARGDDVEHCSNCRSWRPAYEHAVRADCAKVVGEVESWGLCDLWRKAKK